ncbi:hypothetical protein BIS06_01465 [Halomonas sp. BBD48]|nr:hypothetical protein [Halomonas sp. BBD48]
MANDMADTLQVHGFLSQAWVISKGNDFFGPSSDDNGSFQYREMGLNASLRPHRDVLVAAQLLSRRAGIYSDDTSPVLDYGIVDYQFLSSEERRLGLQIGRFKNPFGFYNQTRDVAFTRPSILLPQSIYFERTRSLALAADGAAIYGEERLDSGVLRTQFGVGTPRTDDDLVESLGLGEEPGSLDGRTSFIGQLLYEHDGGRIIGALSAASVDAHFDSGPGGPGSADFHFQPWILSFQYNEEDWSLTAEYALRSLSLQGFDNSRRNFDMTGESWYVQYTRRFEKDWQWLLRYDVLANDREDRWGNQYENAGYGPAYSRYAKDWTTGLQWRLTPQIMLSTEYHLVEGTGWLPIINRQSEANREKYWDMWLMQASFRF